MFVSSTASFPAPPWSRHCSTKNSDKKVHDESVKKFGQKIPSGLVTPHPFSSLDAVKKFQSKSSNLLLKLCPDSLTTLSYFWWVSGSVGWPKKQFPYEDWGRWSTISEQIVKFPSGFCQFWRREDIDGGVVPNVRFFIYLVFKFLDFHF